MMGMCYRYHVGLQLLRRLLQERTNGRVLSALQWGGSYLPDWRPGRDYRTVYSAQRRLGGGVLLDSIHDLDLARWLFGEVRDVSCSLNHLGSLEIDVEDEASLVLTHHNGVVSELHLDYLQRSRRQFLEVVCEKGNLRWDFDERCVRRYDADRKAWQALPYDFEVNDMYLAELRDFLALVEGHGPSPIPFEDGLRTLRLALAAKHSSLERRSVPLPASNVPAEVVR
jgi:predicted dehydrogenase